jgi:hypothetical protein
MQGEEVLSWPRSSIRQECTTSGFVPSELPTPSATVEMNSVKWAWSTGEVATRPWGHAAIAAGLAWTGFGSCQGSGGCSTVGVPVVAEVAARLFSIMGVGAQAFGNLNTKSVYLGAVLFLQLGWLP